MTNFTPCVNPSGDEPVDIKQLSNNLAFMGSAADQMITKARNCMFAAHEVGHGINLYGSTEKAIDALEESEEVGDRWLGLLAQIGWLMVIDSMGKSVTEKEP